MGGKRQTPDINKNGCFDLKSELAKYGEYHSNKLNVSIHMVFPHELFSYSASIASALSQIPGPNPLLNFTTLAMLGFISFYVILDPFAGLLTVPIIYAFLVTAQQFVLTTPNGIGFVGHGVFEKRAPALLNNLLQALVMAPFFVFLEVLFICGYRPGLQREVRSEIGIRILKFRREQKTKAVGSAKATNEAECAFVASL
ncbi:hypothetical protein BX661DRAFT_183320 [Kickxella alabastrina]|uniref:uncharacterized protein n=1 Tax=Kickxella alabastrina TaxID=61397 RepID=UPI0022211948|nr:uncharacterized protein BX661DRAFT_183320 [Kickxella alabastrina]KAI7826715.1 hypothetical protein BX661DRAFT_183320 [Kickxella alabastrina]